MSQVTRRRSDYFMATDGKGKWHAAAPVTREPACGIAATLVDDNPITVPTLTPVALVHPLVCRNCLRVAGGAK